MMIKCPYCKDGVRAIRVYRFIMNPRAPREYPEPQEGWGWDLVRCCVCQGVGKVEEWESRKQKEGDGWAPLWQPVKEEAEICRRCGRRDEVMMVQRRIGSGRQFRGAVEAWCVVCRSQLRGSWRWPREEVRPLKVMAGGKR